jgi:NADPH-dependent curcumin reductase CurA
MKQEQEKKETQDGNTIPENSTPQKEETPIKKEYSTDDGITREWMDLLDGSKVPVAAKIVLPDGSIAKIAEGTGSHAMDAQEEATIDGKFSFKAYTSALMSSLITIDDKHLAPADFLKISMKSYNKINTEFMTINF